MRWHDVLTAALDPSSTMGALLITRRAMDQEMPLAKRFGFAFLGALPAAVLSVPAAIFGAYQAVDTRFDLIEKEQISQRSLIEARTELREAQMAQFQQQCSETQKHLGALEARINAAEIAVSKLATLEDVRHGSRK